MTGFATRFRFGESSPKNHNMIKVKHLPVSVAACVLVTMVLAFSSFASNGRRYLQSQAPPVVARMKAIASLPSTNQLQLAIGLPLRDQEGLDALLKQIYDPASASFHQFITPEQFVESFGPTEMDYQTVIDFMEKNGLKVTGVHPNHLVLDVAGSVEDIEKVFQLTIRVYQHPKEQRIFYAPDTTPSVDAALAIALLSIDGLDNYSLPRPASLHLAPNNPTPNVGSGPGSTYMGKDFRQAYVPGTPLTGAGQSVALVQFDGYYASDITAYATLAGLPPVTLSNVAVNGGIATPGTDNIEVALDIEMAMSMATNLASILVYEAPKGTTWPTILSRIANDNLAKQIGCSWGGGSANPNAAAELIFKQMAAQGQSFFCASGDADAYVGAAVFPDDSTNITVVGGTTLSTTTGHNRISETTWNSGGGLGTGGGISTIYPIPAWQLGLNPFSTNGSSASARNVPDVSLTADNVYVKYGNGQSTTVVGTSCAAPLWAGFMALVNQQAVNSGKPVIGFINPAVYEFASQSTYSSNFFDITTGNNTWSNSPTAYFATAGYDLCTGLGSPRGTNFINALVNPDPLIVVSNVGFRAVGTPAGLFNVSSQTFFLTNAGAASLNWSLGNTSVWLSVSSTNGTLAPGAGTSVTVSLNSVASNLIAGTYSATLSFSNATGRVGHNRYFSLKTTDPLVILPPSSFSFSGPPSGPFSPNTQSVILTNPTPGTVSWGINNTSTWFTVSPISGSLAPGDQASLTFTPSAAALNLTDGIYSSSFRVTNLTSQFVQLIKGTMSVGIIQNSGFETGDFTRWTLVGNGYDGTNLYNGVVSSNSLTDGSGPSFIHSGLYGAFLGDTNAATLSQSFSTTPGQNYRLSFWLANPVSTNGAGQQFSVNWNTNSPGINQIYFITNPPVLAWTNMVFIVQATDTNTTLQFGSANPPNGFGLDDVTVVALSPPAFISQPTNLTSVAGSAAVFAATASGFAPLTYQWYKDGISLANGSGVSGATTANLTLAGVTTNQAANYSLVVTNLYGAATSSVATLTVVLPPAITTAITNQTIQCGSDATFVVAASGTPPLSYHWTLDGTFLSGATNTSVLLPNVHAPNHTVAVIVTDFYSSVTNSSVLTVFDSLAPEILLNGPNPIYVELGDVFSDPGATASDVCAGSVAVVTNGVVNLGILSTNQITYTANDGNGNTNTITRIVIVRDTTAPVIIWSFTNLTLLATSNNSVPMPDVTGTNFILATDLSGAMTVSQNPTNNYLLGLGTNSVVLTVTDPSGNAAYSTNIITVVAPTNGFPVIAGIAANPDGSFDLNLLGTPGLTYILETATNLYPPIDWLAVTTNTLGTNAGWQFTDMQATNFSKRFYRLKTGP